MESELAKVTNGAEIRRRMGSIEVRRPIVHSVD